MFYYCADYFHETILFMARTMTDFRKRRTLFVLQSLVNFELALFLVKSWMSQDSAADNRTVTMNAKNMIPIRIPKVLNLNK